ncbi:MAG: hypothetical protein KH359_01920 [Clostridiales bacterium]|nr:hypothetical protein [Clostridiales bacterium]
MSEIYLRKDFIETLEPEEVVIYTALKKEIDERYRADENSIIINTSIDFIYYGLTNSWDCPRKLKDNLSNGLKGLIDKGLITLISNNKNNYVIQARELYINSKSKDTPYFITTSEEIEKIFAIEYNQKLKLFKYALVMLSTIFANMKYAFNSMDTLSMKANISKPSIITYNSILEDNKIIYVHNTGNAKINEDGSIQKQSNTYGRYADKKEIKAQSEKYDKNINLNFTKKLDSTTKTSIKQKYNSFVKGTYKHDLVKLYELVVAYNEDCYVQKYNNQLDLSVFNDEIKAEYEQQGIAAKDTIKELNKTEEQKQYEKLTNTEYKNDYVAQSFNEESPF